MSLEAVASALLATTMTPEATGKAMTVSAQSIEDITDLDLVDLSVDLINVLGCVPASAMSPYPLASKGGCSSSNSASDPVGARARGERPFPDKSFGRSHTVRRDRKSTRLN